MDSVSLTADQHIWLGFCNHVSSQLYDHMTERSQHTLVQQRDKITILLNGRVRRRAAKKRDSEYPETNRPSPASLLTAQKGLEPAAKRHMH